MVLRKNHFLMYYPEIYNVLFSQFAIQPDFLGSSIDESKIKTIKLYTAVKLASSLYGDPLDFVGISSMARRI